MINNSEIKRKIEEDEREKGGQKTGENKKPNRCRFFFFFGEEF